MDHKQQDKDHVCIVVYPYTNLQFVITTYPMAVGAGAGPAVGGLPNAGTFINK